ncbi:MAG: PPC domain-containing protein, partial [Pirellula sp.]
VERDAIPGIRDIRIATPRGVSTVGQIVLVSDPIAYEKKDNDTPAGAQEISLPITACGRIEKAEDVDYYRFHADANTSLCFHVMCMRLQDRVHDLQQHADPILTLREINGNVIASSDNEFFADPLIYHRFEREGDYLLEIRDVRYQGNAYWEYSIEINEHPMVMSAFPMGVIANQSTSIELIEHGVTGQSRIEVNPTAKPGNKIQFVAAKVQESITRALPLVVSDVPMNVESEDASDSMADAQSISVPAGINGRIASEGDVDFYSFQALKGERYTFEVFARRLGSSLDSHLRVLDEKGNQLQIGDDMRIGKRNYADSLIENWTVPANGKYFLEVRDLHLRGGKSFVYFVEVTRSDPQFALYVDTDKTPIAPGTTGVVFVRAEKKNGFNSEIQLEVSGLPKNVTAHCGRILAGKSVDGCIVFEADANAAMGATNIEIHGIPSEAGSAAGGPSSLRSMATVYQEIYQPGGGRGHWPVESHVIAITAPSDIRKVDVSTVDLRLKPGESKEIDIEIHRAEDFDKNVTLEATYSHLNTIFGSSLPEGVTVDGTASNTLLTSGATKGKIVLKAAANAAPVERQQIVIMANVSLNFVMKATYASKPIQISIDANSK